MGRAAGLTEAPPLQAFFDDDYGDRFTVDGHARTPAAVDIEGVPDRAHLERAVGHHGTLCDCLGILRQEAGQGLHDNGLDFLKCLHLHDCVAHADPVATHPADYPALGPPCCMHVRQWSTIRATRDAQVSGNAKEAPPGMPEGGAWVPLGSNEATLWQSKRVASRDP